MKEINVYDLNLNPMKMIGEDWWLITAGNKNGYNSMTASWGHMGSLWERKNGKAHLGLPTIIIYVRPQRHTKNYLDHEELFTLSVFDDSYKKTLGYLGRVSGKDTNKMEQVNLTPIFENNTTYFKEAKMVFVCRKLYQSSLKKEGFIDQSLIKKIILIQTFIPCMLVKY